MNEQEMYNNITALHHKVAELESEVRRIKRDEHRFKLRLYECCNDALSNLRQAIWQETSEYMPKISHLITVEQLKKVIIEKDITDFSFDRKKTCRKVFDAYLRKVEEEKTANYDELQALRVDLNRKLFFLIHEYLLKENWKRRMDNY